MDINAYAHLHFNNNNINVFVKMDMSKIMNVINAMCFVIIAQVRDLIVHNIHRFFILF